MWRMVDCYHYLTSLGPHLVHDTVATFTATDRILGFDDILLATLCMMAKVLG